MTCEWQFHGVSRQENGDGTATLRLEGHRYASNAERKAGMAAVLRGAESCATRTVPQQFAEFGPGDVRQVVESGEPERW